MGFSCLITGQFVSVWPCGAFILRAETSATRAAPAQNSFLFAGRGPDRGTWPGKAELLSVNENSGAEVQTGAPFCLF